MTIIPTTAWHQTALGLLAFSLAVATTLPARGSELAPYRWKNRLLLVFAPNALDSDLAAFEKNLSARSAEVLDRDLLVFRILEEGASSRGDEPLAFNDAASLRRRYKIKPGRFTVILIGKDGGLKLVRECRGALQEIFDLIDTMPMRRREMREKNAARDGLNRG